MQGDTDAQLVAKSLQRNEKAFRELVRRHQPLVLSVVRAVLGSRDEVDDVVQEAFIKIYRGLGSFRGEAQFSSWAYRIARNSAINTAKRRRLDSDPIDDLPLAAPSAERPDAQYEQTRARDVLDSYLTQLNEEYRVVLELRYLGEKSYAEIAEATELPVGTVKSYVHRGKIELKRLMTKRTADGERKGL